MGLPSWLPFVNPPPLPPPPPPTFLESLDLTKAVLGAATLIVVLVLIAPPSKGEGSSSSSLARIIYARLFTKEDPFNFHKTLGISCLLSYIFRFVKAGPSDMGFGATPETLLTIAVHASLSISSLVFRIPMKRIASGYRIWPEYRLHSIIFACRSLAGMLLTWYELRNGLEPNYYLNSAIVIGTLLAADAGSASMPSAGRSSTIRDLDANAPTIFFFSAMQFQATMGCLFGLRRFSTQFLYVWIIQFNAFLMTVRRKNLAPHSALVTVYGLMLVFGFCVATYEHHQVGAFAMVTTLGTVAACLRIGVGMPKYPLWISMAVLANLGRPTIAPDHPLAGHWPYAFAASLVALSVVGARKIARDNRRSAKAAAEAAAAEATAKLAAANVRSDTPDVNPTPSCTASVGGEAGKVKVS